VAIEINDQREIEWEATSLIQNADSACATMRQLVAPKIVKRSFSDVKQALATWTTLLGGPGTFNVSTLCEWNARMEAKDCSRYTCDRSVCDVDDSPLMDEGCLHEKIRFNDAVNRSDLEVNECSYKSGLSVKNFQRLVQFTSIKGKE